MDNKKPIPPQFALRLLNKLLKTDLVEEVSGDLEEQFYYSLEEKSRLRANLNYWYQVISYIRPFAIRKKRSYNSNKYSMYKNYFKIGYRNLLRNKGYSIINIGGLSVGLAVSMLIGLWVNDELTFDNYHKDKDRIAQVILRQTTNGDTGNQNALPIPLKAELLNNYGESFDHLILSFWRQELIISHEDTRITTEGNFMGKDVISLFSLKMLNGNNLALEEQESIIISETLSKIIFKDTDPMGKLLKIDNSMSVIVKGVYQDPPKNSTLHGLSFIAPWKLWENTQAWVRMSTTSWDNSSFQLFAKIAENTNMENVSEKIKLTTFNNVDDREKAHNPELFLHPMKDWHLRTEWADGGLLKFVWLFGLVGVFVLILACINFMNLSTAQSEKRSKEVGIRKSLGSLRSQLIGQFLTESFLVVILSFALAVVMVMLAIPYFNQLADKDLIIPFANLYFWIISTGFLIFTALLAGSYPALYLSSFQPVTVLKGTFRAGKSALLFRKLLVVIQFTVSIALVIGTILVQKQVQFTKDRPLGYNANGTIMIWSNSEDFKGKLELLRTQLKNRNAIVEMSESSSPLTNLFSYDSEFEWEGKDTEQNINFGFVKVSPEYGQTAKWEISAGRDFSREMATDSLAFILNKKAVEKMGLVDPIGKVIKWGSNEQARNFRVIGVINDMIMQSPFNEVRPTIYTMSKSPMNCMSIRLNPEKSPKESLAIIENVFNENLPATPFDYKFTDQEHGLKFAAEERIGTLSGIFAILASFISCLGVFGMASFVAARRTKEIGIRKVLGASVVSIWSMLSTSFVWIIGISCLLATPATYYVMSRWLDSFHYKTSLHWSVFAAAGLGALLITLLTVSYHSITSATSNPVKSLRSE